MKLMPIPKCYRWLAALAALVLYATFLLWSRLVWTPVQRYYLGVYFKCFWPGADPASSSKIRWIYKTAPDEKPELALEDDAIPAASSGTRQIPMELSRAARQAGWTGLMQGPEEQLQIATLKPFLENQFFDGESLWTLLLLPLLCGFLLYLFLLIVWVKYEDWIDSVPWPAEWIEWGDSVRSMFQECRKKIVRVTPRLPELERNWVRARASTTTQAASALTAIEPPKKPLPAVFSPFGVSDGEPKDGFIWDKNREIE